MTATKNDQPIVFERCPNFSRFVALNADRKRWLGEHEKEHEEMTELLKQICIDQEQNRLRWARITWLQTAAVIAGSVLLNGLVVHFILKPLLAAAARGGP